MKRWVDKINQLKQDEKNLKFGIVAANNHYGGFGPGTVNMFREMINLEPRSIDSSEMKEIVNTKIKFREPFRPFAPVVMEERAHEYFTTPNLDKQYPPPGAAIWIVWRVT